MPAPQSVEELFALVRKSDLVAEAKLSSFVLFSRSQGTFPATPVEAAKALIEAGLVSVFQAKQLLLGRHRGFDIGKYRVLEGLGSGGMSDVFLCQHKTMGHRVAIKLLPKRLAEREPGTVDQLFREAQAAAALNHPNVVRAHDIDRHGDHYYMVMDYVDGANLHDLVKKRGPFSPGAAAAVIAQAACGLQHVHEAGLVHRDIKPGNLMLDRYGVIRVLDLGLAAFHESSSKNEGTGSGSNDTSSILGTADFLAPEQAVADAPVDIRSDIYSLGVTLYFLLAGKAPFEDLTLAQKLVGHQFKLPPAPVAPQPLLRVLGRMMAKRPELRYQTPSEVVSALFPFADHQLVPPRVDEMPTLSKAASGPLTSRGRGATIVSMVGLAGLGKPTPLPTGLNNSPPSGLHSGPRPARPLSELSGDTPTPGSAPTLMFPPSGSKVPEDFPFDPVKFLSGEDVPVSTDHPTTS